MTWGTSPWGEKIIGAGNLPAMIASISANFYTITWKSNPITVSFANTNKQELDGRGYYYIFIDRVTNAESGVTQTYLSQSVAAVTYASLPAASTTWS
jgi:hypothetical protein